MVIDWINENAFRAYPLKEQVNRTADSGYKLTDDVILDALLMFATPTSNVKLLSIVSNTENIIFTLTGGTVFVIPKASTFPYYSRLSYGSLLVVGEAALDIPLGAHVFTNTLVENCTCIELGAEWLGVTSLQFDSSALLTGDINLIEGYQFDINIAGTELQLGADSSYGIPLGCNKIGDAEDDCDEIISFINGKGPDTDHVFSLSSGAGIILLEDPENHRIFVGLIQTENVDCDPILSNPEL